MAAMPPMVDVLVVDDDPGVARLLQTALRRAGWVVEVATEAEAALERVGRLGPRVVLANRTLPGCEGLAFVRELEAVRPGLPLLLMSAWLEDERRAELLDDPGVAGLLEKPFELERLEQDLRVLLRCPQANAHAAAAEASGGAPVGGAAARPSPRRAPSRGAFFPGATGLPGPWSAAPQPARESRTAGVDPSPGRS